MSIEEIVSLIKSAVLEESKGVVLKTYTLLKKTIAEKFNRVFASIRSLEENPNSQVYAMALKEEIKFSQMLKDKEVLRLAEQAFYELPSSITQNANGERIIQINGENNSINGFNN